MKYRVTYLQRYFPPGSLSRCRPIRRVADSRNYMSNVRLLCAIYLALVGLNSSSSSRKVALVPAHVCGKFKGCFRAEKDKRRKRKQLHYFLHTLFLAVSNKICIVEIAHCWLFPETSKAVPCCWHKCCEIWTDSILLGRKDS